MQTAATVSALKALTGMPNNETAILLGATAAGDGGGGTFYFDNASTTADDDGIVIKPNSLSTGRWKRIFDGNINVLWYASNVVSGNWSPAFQAAVNTFKPVFVPRGSYRIDTTIVNKDGNDAAIIGQDLGTELYTTNDIDMLYFTSTVGQFKISNIVLSARINMNNGAAIRLVWNSGARKLGSIENVKISTNGTPNQFKYGVRVLNPQELVLRDVIIEGSDRSKLIAVDLSSDRSAIAPTLENVKVYTAQICLQVISGANAEGKQGGIEGVKVSGCDFVECNQAVIADNSTGNGGPGFNMTACHINAYAGCLTFTNFDSIFITDTLAFMKGTGFNHGVSINSGKDVFITSCVFHQVDNGPVYGVICNNTQDNQGHIHVINNDFQLKSGGSETGIWFGNTCSNSFALYNLVRFGGIDVVNTGTGNTVVGNVKI